MKILGLDVGLCKTGWGLIKKGKKLQCVDYGLIKPNPKLPLEQRLALLWSNTMNIIHTHNPENIAIEQTFFGLNASSGIRLGAAYGAIISAAGLAKVPVTSYPTTVIKQKVAGKGNATKEDVMSFVCKILKTEIDQEDISDALATAICHLQKIENNSQEIA
ncbi:crossover junction endodeoxyribonuclease RuvC [Candidatus Cytomitobacter indipagum]|uniref:Crossover junction endodeoxyribonuclease RuvC n=1 Tax=Candidatus Cytomitobacter indipagum TaxID=2601575 RepID=A0A5C0UDW6_9PROT|nr:crossover junction endodeoxyribonuclease RuvC [Candidatus Cytomitobacter indipagum]QEK38208.1 crossover junction endodeoxyribonuclease RuvC [Candidatus Cytomitobacter indipagum]